MDAMYNKTTKSDIFKIDPRIISFNDDNNPRKDYGDMESLINYIRENGTSNLPEILVRKIKTEDGSESYELVHGFRRMHAITTLINEGIDVARVTCKVVGKDFTKDMEVLTHLTNNSGKNLLPYEEANIYKTLVSMGYTQAEISKMSGKTQSHISNMLLVASSSKRVQNALRDGIVSTTTVLKVMQKYPENSVSEQIIMDAIDVMNTTGKSKVTDKTIETAEKKTPIAPRQSKYQKILVQAIAKVVEQENTAQLAILRKAEQIIQIMDMYNDPAELATKLSEVM